MAQQRLQELHARGLLKEEFSEEREFAEPRAMWRQGELTQEDLLTEEGKEYSSQDTNYRSKLANPEEKHPSYQSSFKTGNFFSHPSLKTLLNGFNGSVFSSFFSIVDYLDKGLSGRFSQFFPQCIRYGNHRHFALLSHLKDTIRQLVCQAQSSGLVYAAPAAPPGVWLKAIYLKVGDQIAVTAPYSSSEDKIFFSTSSKDILAESRSNVSWSRIVAIDFAGYEQVYDIEVEGTHNFVAGHWVEREAGSEPG